MSAGYKAVEVLVVKAWGKTVGGVVPDRSGHFAFAYEPAWARTGIELSPALMPTRPMGRIYTFPTLGRATFHGLPPLLSDSIPDRFGNALIDAHLGQRGVRPGDITALDRLAYVGNRGMGALTFEPRSLAARTRASVLELSDLAEQARLATAGHATIRDGRVHEIAELIEVGTSAGGARAKAVVTWNRETGQLRAGNGDAAPGFEHWLLKFDAGDQTADGLVRTIDSGRVEYAYSLMARAAGLRMAETHLLEAEDGRAHFMTRRFDRPDEKTRLHMQTLCALSGMDYGFSQAHDYSGLMMTSASLGADISQAFRAMVFNVLARNGDDHTKNFAYLMDRAGTWSLAPSYDLTFHPWGSRQQMSVNGAFAGITRADFLAVADRFQVPGARQIIAQVEDAIDSWPEFGAAAGVPRDLCGQVAAALAQVSLS